MHKVLSLSAAYCLLMGAIILLFSISLGLVSIWEHHPVLALCVPLGLISWWYLRTTPNPWLTPVQDSALQAGRPEGEITRYG